ncbi:MAG: hypothetical protein NTY19_48410 [Planctomycetota bacterium]|nr:hypothetical protein [Planctomycetota bacterium]
MVVIIFLGVQQQVTTGVYLGVAGGVVFALGIGLSVYRDKLLPDRIANREGLFRILSWR